jgi:hypothetical protein
LAKQPYKWAWIEVALNLAICVVLFFPSHHVLGVAGGKAIHFRLGICVVCLIGIVGLHLHKRTTAAKEVGELSETLEPRPDRLSDEPAIELVYHTTWPNSWRCNLYVMFHKRAVLLILFALSLAPALLAGSEFSKYSHELAIITFPFLYLLGFAFWVTVMALALRKQLRERFPFPVAFRKCRASLTVSGFQDATPDRTYSFDWGRVTDVREHHGDVYVWATLGGGCFIPREAFADRDAAERFHRAAMTLWRSNGTTWPAEDSASLAPAREPAPPPFPFRQTIDDNPYAPPLEPPTSYLGPSNALSSNLAAIAASFVTVFFVGILLALAFWALSGPAPRFLG